MSGIYIPGMEMPTSCAECKFKTGIGLDRWKCCISNSEFFSWDAGWGNETTRHKGCPLVPVPDHGRLIDADEIHYTGEYGGTRVTTKSLIDSMPTIIPAEEGEG